MRVFITGGSGYIGQAVVEVLVVGAMRIVYAFELRHLPEDVDQAFADHRANGATGSSGSEPYSPASVASSS